MFSTHDTSQVKGIGQERVALGGAAVVMATVVVIRPHRFTSAPERKLLRGKVAWRKEVLLDNGAHCAHEGVVKP